MKKLITLMFCAMLLSACASADKEVRDAAEGFKIGFTSRWGPEEKWTQEQKELYLVELLQLPPQPVSWPSGNPSNVQDSRV